MRQIVVGVDGSEPSVRALEWAAAEAHTTGSELVVVYAWTVPAMAYSASFLPAPQAKAAFQEAAKQTMAEILARVDLAGVRVEARVVEGHPGASLVSESRDADMVVVGHRERGALAEFVLGSTAHYVGRHAAVPVVVVPEVSPVSARAA